MGTTDSIFHCIVTAWFRRGGCSCADISSAFLSRAPRRKRDGRQECGCAEGLHAASIKPAATRDEQRVEGRAAEADARRLALWRRQDAARATVAVKDLHAESRRHIRPAVTVHAHFPGAAVVGPIRNVDPIERLLPQRLVPYIPAFGRNNRVCSGRRVSRARLSRRRHRSAGRGAGGTWELRFEAVTTMANAQPATGRNFKKGERIEEMGRIRSRSLLRPRRKLGRRT